MDIYLTNGAPFSGKDTLANRLMEFFENSVYIRFKDPLYQRFAERHNLSIDEVIVMCTGKQKDEPNERIGGLIPRQVLIDISENEIKVNHGPEGVALKVIDNILDTEQYGRKTFVFPDGGFEAERNLFARVLPRFGLNRMITIRIIREGCNFANDSRNFLENPDVTIYNDVDETHLPEEQRGQHMFTQFVRWYETQT
jgi:hypothetical protein